MQSTFVNAYNIPFVNIFLKLTPNHPDNAKITPFIIEFNDKGESSQFIALKDLDYKLVLNSDFNEIVFIGSAASKENASQEEIEKGNQLLFSKIHLFNNRYSYGSYLEIYQLLCSIQHKWIRDSFIKGYFLTGLGENQSAYVCTDGYRRAVVVAMLIKEIGLEFCEFSCIDEIH